MTYSFVGGTKLFGGTAFHVPQSATTALFLAVSITGGTRCGLLLLSTATLAVQFSTPTAITALSQGDSP